MRCIGCGCTDDRACPGGCSWFKTKPPICSACVLNGKLCGDTSDGAHRLHWLTKKAGYCEDCCLPFVASEVA